MKIREGFVSNSSSSSFLLSKPTSDKRVVIPAEVQELPASKIETLKELSDYFNTVYWDFNWESNPESMEVFGKALRAIAEGKTLFYAITDNWDELNIINDPDTMALNDIEILHRGSC